MAGLALKLIYQLHNILLKSDEYAQSVNFKQVNILMDHTQHTLAAAYIHYHKILFLGLMHPSTQAKSMGSLMVSSKLNMLLA